MEKIQWVMDVIAGNLREARGYIVKAYEMRDECREAAEWCRDMASKHLEFNAKGNEIVKKFMADFDASAGNADFSHGMKSVYGHMQAGMMKDQAEIQAMIQTFK